MNRVLLAALAALWIAGSDGVSAQPVPAAGNDAAKREPGSGFRSALDAYRAFEEVPVAPWRASNDTVGKIGGHAGALGAKDTRGGALPVPTTQQAVPTAPAPATGARGDKGTSPERGRP